MEKHKNALISPKQEQDRGVNSESAHQSESENAVMIMENTFNTQDQEETVNQGRR